MKLMKLQSIRGMNDIAGSESFLWRYIESKVRKVFESFGYQEIRTPILEPTELFKRGVGDSTDIVEKEMYSFEDRNGESLSLRPEGTASVVRALNQHSLTQDSPVQKLYYIGPMFRHERPQKGRYRQFYQFGAELFGVKEAMADIEILNIQYSLLQALGVSDVSLNLSSLGCSVCRPPYRELLIEAMTEVEGDLCEDCVRRKEKNPLRVFDCKVEKCKKIAKHLPKMLNHLCEDCEEHFNQVRDGLVALKIPFEVNENLVRGLDYYNRTAFEFIYSGDLLGAQATVSAGGRYDSLVSDLGGRDCPAVGFAAGIERLAFLLEDLKSKLEPAVDLYFVLPDREGVTRALQISNQLRSRGVRVEVDLQLKKMKHQMKRANKLRSRYVLILGSEEIKNNLAILKNMSDGTQEEILLTRLEESLLDRFKTTNNYKY